MYFYFDSFGSFVKFGSHTNFFPFNFSLLGQTRPECKFTSTTPTLLQVHFCKSDFWSFVYYFLQYLKAHQSQMLSKGLNQEHFFKNWCHPAWFLFFPNERLSTAWTCVWTLPDLQGLTCSWPGTKHIIMLTNFVLNETEDWSTRISR